MKATTIKLEGKLLQELELVKPKSVSVSAFVREALWRDLQRRRLADAALKYESFLESNSQEQEWIEEWEAADLASPARRRRR